MTTDEIIRQAFNQALSEGMTELDFTRMAARIAAEETAKRRDAAAREVYGGNRA